MLGDPLHVLPPRVKVFPQSGRSRKISCLTSQGWGYSSMLVDPLHVLPPRDEVFPQCWAIQKNGMFSLPGLRFFINAGRSIKIACSPSQSLGFSSMLGDPGKFHVSPSQGWGFSSMLGDPGKLHVLPPWVEVFPQCWKSRGKRFPGLTFSVNPWEIYMKKILPGLTF